MNKRSSFFTAATGFLLLTAAFAAEFRQPRLLGNGNVEIVLQGNPGSAFVIESSGDLVNWSTNESGTLPDTGIFSFEEFGLTTNQFFRARTSNTTGANPLNTVATLETNIVTRLIPVTGGSVRITNANNVRFQLTIPTNSLLSDAEISLQAVTSLTGAPLTGGPFAAVKAAPEGLFLFNPAELLITFPNTESFQEAIGFAFHETGEEFHWYPATVTANTVRFSIDRLHGYGLGRSTAQQVEQQLTRLPTDPIDRLLQDLGALQWEGRQPAGVSPSPRLAKSAAPPADWLDTSRARLKREWDNRLKPQLTRAKTACATARRSIPETLRWAHAVSVLGLDGLFDNEFGEMYVSFCAGIENCIRQLELICQNKSDPETVREMLRLARQSELLGCDHADLLDRALNCARLKVTFDSKIDLSIFNDLYETHVRAPYVPLTLGDPDFTGQGPLNYIRFNSSHPSCTYSNFRMTDSVFKVVSLTFDLNLQKSEGGFLKMTIDPGEPTEQMHFQCGGESGETEEMRAWREGWDFFRQDDTEPRGFLIKDWVFDEQGLVAIKQFNQTFTSGGLIYQEFTTIEVSHDPLP